VRKPPSSQVCILLFGLSGKCWINICHSHCFHCSFQFILHITFPFHLIPNNQQKAYVKKKKKIFWLALLVWMIFSKFGIKVILSSAQDSVTNNNGFWIVWLNLLTSYTINLCLQAIWRYSWCTQLHFTVTHALGFSVFTSHFPVMELKQSHCDYIFQSYTKSSQAAF
jgi:hypothetical protein